MACEAWTEKLDTYLDGELSAPEEQALRDHLRTCSACAADAFDRMQTKRAIHSAGARFHSDPAFRARMEAAIAKSTPARRAWHWPAIFALSAGGVVFAAVLSTAYLRTRYQEQHLIGELVDLHVATLASANPVDVVSTDRHTVKPWFEGKLPFTFDLPNLQNSPFTLIGGRIAYLNQAPGAELVFRIRQHNLSVFVFQETAAGQACSLSNAGALNFHLESWSRNGLCYFVIGDVNSEDLNTLAALMQG